MSTPRRSAMQVDGTETIDVFASPCPLRVDPRRDSLSVLSERFSSTNIDDEAAVASAPVALDNGMTTASFAIPQTRHNAVAMPTTLTSAVRVLGVPERARHRLSTDLNASTFSNPVVLQTLSRAAAAAQQSEALLRKRSFEIHSLRRPNSGNSADSAAAVDAFARVLVVGDDDDDVDAPPISDDEDDLHGPFDAKVSRSVPSNLLSESPSRARCDVASMRRRASFREAPVFVSQLGSVSSGDRSQRDDEYSRRTPARVSPMSLGSSLPPSLPSSLPSSVASSRSSSTRLTPRDSTSPAVVHFERAPSFHYEQRAPLVESPTNDLPRAISSPEVTKAMFAAAVASPSLVVPGAAVAFTSTTGTSGGSGPLPRRATNSRRRRVSKRNVPAFNSMMDLRSLQTISREFVFDMDDSQPPSSTESSAPPTRPETPLAQSVTAQQHQQELDQQAHEAQQQLQQQEQQQQEEQQQQQQQQQRPQVQHQQHELPQQAVHAVNEDDAPATQVVEAIENSIADDAPTAHNSPTVPINANDRAVNSMELMSPTLKAFVKQHQEHQQHAQQQATEFPLCSPTTTKEHVPLLPTVRSAHAGLPSLSAETMHRVLAGEFSSFVQRVIVIDCRFPFEFDGGHIVGALNMPREDHVVSHFFDAANVPRFASNTTIVFHCEFSSCRGPEAMKILRAHDRTSNPWPSLAYPETYLLDGGYKRFFLHSSNNCDPPLYRPMDDPDHAVEMNRMMNDRTRRIAWRRNKSKSMGAIAPNVVLSRSMIDLTRRFDSIDARDTAMKTARNHDEEDDDDDEEFRVTKDDTDDDDVDHWMH